MEMSDREKAAFILGMFRAFKAVRWPRHFSRDDKAMWKQRAKWAHDMLDGGAFNPLHVWRVRDLANEELGSPYQTD